MRHGLEGAGLVLAPDRQPHPSPQLVGVLDQLFFAAASGSVTVTGPPRPRRRRTTPVSHHVRVFCPLSPAAWSVCRIAVEGAEVFAELVAGALPEHARGKPVEIWFQEEARVGQQGTLTRVWARRGTRPGAPRDRRYAWAYLFGAVRPERAVGAALVLPYADTEATGLHLAEIGRHVAPGAHAVVVLDGAGRHAAGGLAVPENLSLLPLPRYSPELNPVENVWE